VGVIKALKADVGSKWPSRMTWGIGRSHEPTWGIWGPPNIGMLFHAPPTCMTHDYLGIPIVQDHP